MSIWKKSLDSLNNDNGTVKFLQSPLWGGQGSPQMENETIKGSVAPIPFQAKHQRKSQALNKSLLHLNSDISTVRYLQSTGMGLSPDAKETAESLVKSLPTQKAPVRRSKAKKKPTPRKKARARKLEYVDNEHVISLKASKPDPSDKGISPGALRARQAVRKLKAKRAKKAAQKTKSAMMRKREQETRTIKQEECFQAMVEAVDKITKTPINVSEIGTEKFEKMVGIIERTVNALVALNVKGSITTNNAMVTK